VVAAVVPVARAVAVVRSTPVAVVPPVLSIDPSNGVPVSPVDVVRSTLVAVVPVAQQWLLFQWLLWLLVCCLVLQWLLVVLMPLWIQMTIKNEAL